jgi:hypothetical protein
MKHVLVAAIILILAGCCTEGSSPAYITYFLNKGYDGRPVNQFFVDYGYPAGVFDKANGARVYRWVSTQYKVEPRQAAPANYVSLRGNYQIVDTYRGFTERQYCEIRIYADSAGNIRDFAVAVDSAGEWSASRCSEIFNQAYSPSP